MCSRPNKGKRKEVKAKRKKKKKSGSAFRRRRESIIIAARSVVERYEKQQGREAPSGLVHGMAEG